MSPERLKKVEELYHAVLEVSPQQRNTFLHESCGNDEELRREIESLLVYENDFDSLINSSPKVLAKEVFSDLQTDSNLADQTIKQYKIESKIGEGGMGTVYLAKDTRLERQVALKMLSDEFANDGSRRNRFFQEAKSASALNHPNILTVHEIGEFNGKYFIVTEFIKGNTLTQYLVEEKPTLNEILDIATQIASALVAAHEAGIIHRDIKPDNIMIRDDGIIKVLDFGIAKLLNLSGTKAYNASDETPTAIKPLTTMPGMIIGTPNYMSPEQARGQKIDVRSDIFSFGVLLYEMFAGQLPFSGISKIDIIGAILKEEPRPLSEIQPEIPPNIEKIVHKALRKDREQRYQHIKDVFIDLNDIKKTLEYDSKIVFQTEIGKASTTINSTSGIVLERRFSLIHLLLFLLAAAGIGLAVWSLLPKVSVNLEPVRSAEVVSWASKPGEVYSVGTFSPDGKMVAFTSTKSGTRNIWLKQTSSGEPVQITKDEFRNENPIWSPTGDELAFFSTRGNKAGFWRIPILGGSAKPLLTIEDGSSLLRLWSKNNQIYYESKNELFVIDAVSGAAKQITDFAIRQIEVGSINISPDEQNIVYTTVENGKWNLWFQKLNTNTPQKLLTGVSEIRNTFWHPDNKHIFFSDAVEGIFQIFVTDLNATPARQVSNADRDCLTLDITADGTKILYGSAKEESDIWGFNIKENQEFTIAADIDSELWATVSPDSKSIAYQSIKNLSQGNKLLQGRILTQTINPKGEPVEVALGGLPLWSPDGKYLAHMRWVDNRYRLETTNLNTRQNHLLATDISSNSYTLLPYNRTQTKDFSWSPDSRKIAYLSEKSGSQNIWVVNPDGSDDFQLTDNQDKSIYLYCPLWSADGKSLFYSTKNAKTAADGLSSFQIWQAQLETKKITELTPPGKFLRLIGWGANGSEMLFVNCKGMETIGLQPEVTLHKLDIKTGAVKQILALKDTYLFNIHLSPDGKNIAFAAHREEKDNLWLISSGGGEEKKLTANNDSRLYFSSLAWSPDGNSIYYGKQSRFSLLSMLTNFK